MQLCKRFLITLLISFSIAAAASAQTFYIDCADDRAFTIVMKVVQYLKYDVTGKPDQFDFSIRCVLESGKDYDKPSKGYMVIYSQSGVEVARTKAIKRKSCAANGFNVSADIFQVLAEIHLPDILSKLTTKKSE